MKLITLNDMYVSELQDILGAENQTFRLLSMLGEAAVDFSIRRAILSSIDETRKHTKMIKDTFPLIQEPVKTDPSSTIRDLTAEAKRSFVRVKSGRALDEVCACLCLRALSSHQSRYRTCRAFAGSLGYKEQVSMFAKTYDDLASISATLDPIVTGFIKQKKTQTHWPQENASVYALR